MPAAPARDIDPLDLDATEAFDDRCSQPTWFIAPVHPWRRYFARMIDYYTLGVMVYGIVCMFVFADSQDLNATRQLVGNEILASIAVTVLMVPVLALFVGLTGLSPGKWLAGIRVVQHWDGRPIGFGAALSRELFVAIQGMALGIPLLNVVTLVLCRRRLEQAGSMSWDRRFGATVLYAPTSRAIVARMAVAVVACLAFLLWINVRGSSGG